MFLRCLQLDRRKNRVGQASRYPTAALQNIMGGLRQYKSNRYVRDYEIVLLGRNIFYKGEKDILAEEQWRQWALKDDAKILPP